MEAVSKCLAFSGYKAREDEESQGGKNGGKTEGREIGKDTKKTRKKRVEPRKRKERNRTRGHKRKATGDHRTEGPMESMNENREGT
jgi:FtsZ-interacting cell division protein YlmF